MRVWATVAAGFVLTGCAVPLSNDAPSAQTSRFSGTSIEFASYGLNVSGSGGLEIGFGRAMPGVVEAVARVTDTRPGDPQTNRECGVGPVTAVRFANGLTLNFMDGAFEGWVATAPGSGATQSGLVVGASRATLGNAPLQTTTLGQEFQTDGVYGLIDDTDTVGALWAGATCFFR